MQLLGEDEKCLEEFTGVRASDLKELLQGAAKLSKNALPTTCLARRKGVGFVKAAARRRTFFGEWKPWMPQAPAMFNDLMGSVRLGLCCM